MSTNYRDLVLAEPSLAAYFRLGEVLGTTTLAESKHGYTATASGSTVTLGQASLLTSDPANTAVTLSGSGIITGDTSVEAATRFDRTNPFSVEAWIKPLMGRGSGAQTQGIWDKRDSTSANKGYIFYASWDSTQNRCVLNAQLNNTVAGGNSIRVRTSGIDLINGTVYHVVFTYDGSSLAAGCKFYVNAVATAMGVDINTLSATMSVTIQPALGAVVGSSLEWLGVLDEVAVYNAVLTPTQVANHYNVGSGSPGYRYIKTLAISKGIVTAATADYPNLSTDVVGTLPAALLPASGVTPGTFNNVTVDTTGRVTVGSAVSYLTGNQTITLSGDVTGSGATAIATALAALSPNPAGSYINLSATVNAKGLVTAAASGTFTSGTTYLTASQTLTTTFAAISGMTISLPAAGTYLITGCLYCTLSSSSVAVLSFKLRNTTTSTDVPNSLVAFVNVSSGGQQGTMPITALVVVSGAALIDLWGQIFTGTPTSAQILTVASGGTVLCWHRVA